MRRLPKPVVAMVAGYAIGGGHVLHVVCDLTIAADNARFGQTGPKVGSFDGGFGAGLLANLVGPKKAKEIWFLCRQYDAEQALEMGLVNRVVPLEELEEETVALVPRDARPLPLLAAPAQGQLPRRRGRAQPASSSSRTTPTSSSTAPRRPRRAGTPTGRSADPTSPSSRSGLEPSPALAARGPAADAAGGDRARSWSAPPWPGPKGRFRALPFVAALVGSVFIQIGTNLSNDYSDARRGADTEDRLGPVRVTAGGLMPPRRVLIGTYVAFGVAVAAGLYLAAVAGWELIVVGAASILAGVLYTGGPRPYGYEGLGELFVFLFFGIVAVVGSYFVQTEELRWEAFALAVPVGLLASAILVVNNIRDVDTDRRAGKRTLAVKLGRERARRLFTAMLIVAFVVPPLLVPALSPWVLLGLAALPLVPPLMQDGVDPHRRPVPERRARGHRAAARGLLAAARRRGAAVVKRSVLRLSIPLKEPFVTATGVINRARAAAAARSRPRTARPATARPRRSSPTTASRSSARWRRSRAAAGGARHRRARPRRSRASTCYARQEDRPLAEPAKDAIAVNMTLPAGPPGETAERARAGVGEGYCELQAEGGPARRRRAGGRGARGGGPVAGAARGRERRLDASTRPCARSGRSRTTTSSSSSSPAARLRELAEVRQRVSTPIAADESVASMRELRRALELEACDVVNVKLAGARRLQARARAAARGARQRPRTRSCRARSTAPGGSRRRCSSPPREGALAGVRARDARALRRRASPARCRRPGAARSPCPGPGLGVQVDDEALDEVTAEGCVA